MQTIKFERDNAVGRIVLANRRSTGSTCGFRNVFGRLSMTRVKATSALC
jgi:hypothetical protein